MEGFIKLLDEIQNNIIRKNIIPIASVLEQYVGIEFSIDNSFLDNLKGLIENDEIKLNINNIRIQSIEDKNNVIETLVCSFRSYRSDFLSKDNSNDYRNRSKKARRLLYSYVNLSRSILNYDDYNNLLKKAPSNKKVMLLLGTVDPANDDIKVLEEIDDIIKKTGLKQLYTIIPIYGCNTNQYRNFMNDYDIRIVHLAGHGDIHKNGKYVVCFVDADMTYLGISSRIKQGTELVFINTCYSYELVDNVKSGNYMIVHKGKLSPVVALNFSSLFYDRISVGFDSLNSFSYTYNNTANSNDYGFIQ